MSDPPAGYVRLFTPNAFDPTYGYLGEWRATFPALPTPPGDGQIYEWDFMVPIPGDSSHVIDFFVYGADPPPFPTTEWTFDTRDPVSLALYGWGMILIDVAAPPWWLVTFVNAQTWDGTWAGPFDLGFPILVDSESVGDWWLPPPRVVATGQGRSGASRSVVRGSGIRWQHPKNDVGTGSVVLDRDEAAGIGYGDVVRFSIDGTDRFGILVEEKQSALVVAGEESEELVTLSGRGTVAVYEEVVVAPEGGAAAGRTDQARFFNFASPLLDSSGWPDALVSGPRALPEGWPDPLTQWCWSQDPLTIPVPAGDIYLRQNVFLGADTICEAWCAVDDGYELWWDGQKLFEDTLDTAWTGVAKQQKFFAKAGTHVLAIHARNNNALLAGVFACVITKDANDSITNVVARTEPAGGWHVLAYPAQPPGFTPRKVWLILVQEAIDRGVPLFYANVFNPFDPGATGEVDHANVPWPVVSDISVQVGQDLLSVLHQLSETYLDFDVDTLSAGGIGTLRMYVHKGAPQGAVLSPGVNLGSLQADGRV